LCYGFDYLSASLSPIPRGLDKLVLREFLILYGIASMEVILLLLLQIGLLKLSILLFSDVRTTALSFF
jgi:hypothetical protein